MEKHQHHKKNTADHISNLEIIDDAPFLTLSGNFHAKCVHCYDGDTVHLIIFHKDEYVKIRVRMHGYDSPEMKVSKKLSEEKRVEIKKNAILAKDFISDMILGKVVHLEIISEKNEKYGRILGIVRLNKDDEKSVNDIMIEEGHGYKYNGGKKKPSDEI